MLISNLPNYSTWNQKYYVKLKTKIMMNFPKHLEAKHRTHCLALPVILAVLKNFSALLTYNLMQSNHRVKASM